MDSSVPGLLPSPATLGLKGAAFANLGEMPVAFGLV